MLIMYYKLAKSLKGTELIGVTVGEAENPRKTIPRAIKLTHVTLSVESILS